MSFPVAVSSGDGKDRKDHKDLKDNKGKEVKLGPDDVLQAFSSVNPWHKQKIWNF